MTDTDDTPPHMRMADAVRRDIVYGHLPPGTRIPELEYAKRYHVGPVTAYRTVEDLEDEKLVYRRSYYRYAAPGGPPDPAVTARLGTMLARLRETARRDPEDLATGQWKPRHVTDAENGTWQPRDFWAAMDTSLGADGTLLKIHDNYYAGPAPTAPDPGPPDPGPLSRPRKDTDAVAAQIAARLAAGEWAPGTTLPGQQTLAEDHATQPTLISLALRELAAQGQLTPVHLGGGRYVYLVPSPSHPATTPHPGRTPAALIVIWDDGTRTRHPLHPGEEGITREGNQDVSAASAPPGDTGTPSQTCSPATNANRQATLWSASHHFVGER
jgi:DNA-binding transcriptional regulator YhcF (GntR family)